MSASIDDWNTHWAKFAGTAELNPAQAYRRKLVFDALSLNNVRAPRVLDIGSGQGDFAAAVNARHPHASVLGLELSATGVEHAKQKVPSGTFLQRDLLDDSAPPREFARWATHAICTEVLEHVEQPEVLLEHARAYLAPKAKLVVTVPGGPMSAFDKHIGHRTHFSVEALSKVAARAGFRVVSSFGAGAPFFNLYRLTVIARGDKLIQDAAGDQKLPLAARIAMLGFSALFRLNIDRSRYGWQIVAILEA